MKKIKTDYFTSRYAHWTPSDQSVTDNCHNSPLVQKITPLSMFSLPSSGLESGVCGLCRYAGPCSLKGLTSDQMLQPHL